MPSPFPGMDPYIEQDRVWHDFHQRFVPAMAEDLAQQVDPKYIVSIDDHIYVHDLPAAERVLVGRSDVSLARGSQASAAGGATIENAPVRAFLPAVDAERSSYVEIRDRDQQRVITVIELLSPANKHPGPDRSQYIAKRSEVLASSTHLVEIDLLRGGPRAPVRGLPVCDYYVMVSRYESRPEVGIWPIGLREHLPTVPIPLEAPDVDASLNLQDVFHRVYDGARYRTRLYVGQPKPPLDAADAAWAAQILREAGIPS